MLGHTHILGGVTLAVSTSAITGLYMPYVEADVFSSTQSFIIFGGYMFGAVTGSIIPDIEKKGSTISNRFKFVSFFARLIFGHRGFTHSLLAVFCSFLLLGGICSFLPFIKPFMIGFVIGYLSHLLLDALNPTGVPLFYPYDKKISFAGITTGGLLELALFIVLSATFIAVVKNTAISYFNIEMFKRCIVEHPIYIKVEEFINVLRFRFGNL